MQLELRPLFIGRTSSALGRPTPLQPFPNPDMDGINRHATTSQPSFGSNTRTTRFRLNLPTSLIRQLQPILKNNSTSTKKLAQDRPFRVLCKRSAARRPRKDRAAASRSLSCPRRPDPYPRKIGRGSSSQFIIQGQAISKLE